MQQTLLYIGMATSLTSIAIMIYLTINFINGRDVLFYEYNFLISLSEFIIAVVGFAINLIIYISLFKGDLNAN